MAAEVSQGGIPERLRSTPADAWSSHAVNRTYQPLVGIDGPAYRQDDGQEAHRDKVYAGRRHWPAAFGAAGVPNRGLPGAPRAVDCRPCRGCPTPARGRRGARPCRTRGRFPPRALRQARRSPRNGPRHRPALGRSMNSRSRKDAQGIDRGNSGPPRPRNAGIGTMKLQPARIARPPSVIAAPPMEDTTACSSRNRRLSAETPRPMGRITVPTPRANTSVMATMCVLLRTLEAKYACSITEAQHGADSATMPPRKDARSVVEKRTSPMSSAVSDLLAPVTAGLRHPSTPGSLRVVACNSRARRSDRPRRTSSPGLPCYAGRVAHSKTT